MSRSVRFVTEEEEIPVSVVEDEEDGYQYYRPVAEHVLTPVASQLEIQQMEAEAILGSPAFTDKTTSVSFVETLLLRLLDDLNSGRLTNDEIMKLASYSMDILQTREADAQKQAVIMEAFEGDMEGPFIVSSSSSIIAKQMVDFTLGKILDDIKSGKIVPADMAGLTATVLGEPSSEAEEGLSETELDDFIDETIQVCVSRAQDSREDSPVCDALLDDFMVTTLKNLIHDLEQEVLTKAQIESLATTVKEEAKDILPSDSRAEIHDKQDIQNVLQNILRQLQTGAVELHTLYQIVFAIVYSYNMLKSPPTPEFENKVTNLMKDVLFIFEQQSQGQNIDIGVVHKASERLSKTELDVNQIEQISSTIIETVAKPDIICRTSTSEIARSIVEDALLKAKERLLQEQKDPQLISGVQNIASAIITTLDEEKTATPSVNDIFLDILGCLKQNIISAAQPAESDFTDLNKIIDQIDTREISTDQLEEMAVSVARVISSPLKSESSLMAEINMKEALQNVRDDLTVGAVEKEVVDQMTQNLLTAYRAVQAHDEKAPATLHSLASFFKNILEHVTYKVQCGEFNADDISELSNAFQTSLERKGAALDSAESTLTTKTPQLGPDELLFCLSQITEDIENGALKSKDANKFGKRLVDCGNKIIALLSGVSSAVSTPRSEVVADGLVEEVMKSLQREIESGLLTKESLKEITKTIISTTSESETYLADEAVGFTIRGIHRDVERGIQLSEIHSVPSLDHSPSASTIAERMAGQTVNFTIKGIHRDIERGLELSEIRSVPTLDHSPSASTIAEHMVVQTIDHINHHLKEKGMTQPLLASVATSLASLISDASKIRSLPVEFQAVKKTVQRLIQCLKKDAITQRDAERIFCVILENYKDYVLTDKRQESLPDSLPREDQELVKSLIKETMSNIKRSVAAGKLRTKQFSIPSIQSEAGSTTICADDLVELTFENVTKYFSPKSKAGSSTIYAHDFVDATLDQIKADHILKSEVGSTTVAANEIVTFTMDKIGAEHGLTSDAGSTTIYALDLVNLTLQNLRGFPDKKQDRHKPKDIVDFILEILDTLASELSKGAISDLSMAHFFMVVTGDTSDLHILETNALNNIKRLRNDIAARRSASVYVQRILETYLTPDGTVTEIFSDPVKAVESIMINVSSEILTKFVKATLQSILVELREGHISLPEKAPSTFVLRSASSIVAENVIQEVVSRIKRDISASIEQPLRGVLSRQEFDRAASTLVGSPQIAGRDSQEEKKASDSKHSISSNMSREVEDVVLEALHNMVSNLRLEQSMYPQKAHEEKPDMSNEIQDFVLDTLQNIVTDLQDKKALYELGLEKLPDKTEESEIALQTTESSQTAMYINEVLQAVIQDMKQELEEKSKQLGEDEKGSKSAANLENVVLDCLQNAISDTAAPKSDYGLEPDQENEIKEIVVESIKQTINNIKENKLGEEELKSLRHGVLSFIQADKEMDVTPENMIKLLENELTKIQAEGLDADVLGRITTQLATLGMETLTPEESDDTRHIQSDSDISAPSSLISNLVQDVIFRMSKELESEKTNTTQERTELQEKDNSVSSNSTLKNDVNYNRRVSASSAFTHDTDFSTEFSDTTEICLPDNSETISETENGKSVVVDTNMPDKSLHKSAKQAKSNVDVQQQNICQTKVRNPTSNSNNQVNTPKNSPSKKPYKDRVKFDNKPFPHVDNLHKQIPKPKTPINQFIPKQHHTIRYNAEKMPAQTTIVKKTVVDKIKHTPKTTKEKEMRSVPHQQPLAKSKQSPDTKLNMPPIIKRSAEKNKGPNEKVRPAIAEKQNAEKTQKKPEIPVSTQKHILTKKSSLNSCYSSSLIKVNVTDAKSSPKINRIENVERRKSRTDIGRRSNGKKTTDATREEENPNEVKSLCGIHTTKRTFREPIPTSDTSENSNSEYDHSYTSEIF